MLRFEFDPPLDDIRTLFRQYQEGLGIDLGFQGFEAELETLPAPYDVVIVAYWEKRPAGCVAFKPLEEGVCELKRLYVHPDSRGRGLGTILCEASIDEATRRGYRRMRLDTLPRLTSAIRLYESLGFSEIPPYHSASPGEELLYMERALDLPPSR